MAEADFELPVFHYVEPEPDPMAKHWRRVREAEEVVMVRTGEHEWTLVAFESVAIADQDPWAGWGDQA